MLPDLCAALSARLQLHGNHLLHGLRLLVGMMPLLLLLLLMLTRS
jgi:hypothetical protein